MTARPGAEGIARQFQLLGDHLTESNDTRAARHAVATLAAQIIDGCDWSGITQRTRRTGIGTAAASSPTTLQVDKVQYSLHEGPCVDAVTAAGLYHAPDLTGDSRWPRFSAHTVAHTPVRSVLSLTLSPTPPQAALNLYGRRPDAFTGDIEVSTMFAAHATTLLRHIQSIDKVANLERALTSSRLIGTAIGILMYANKISADDAFQRLAHFSQHHNRKLVDVADHVTRTGELPES